MVALTPESAVAWSDLGWAFQGLKRYDESISAFETAISLNERFGLAWNNKGVTLFRLGRHDEALSAFDRACELDSGGLLHGRSTPYRNRVLPLIGLKRFDEVISATDTLLQYLPNDAEMWLKRGQALAARRRYDAAEEAMLDAFDARSWRIKAQALRAAGKLEEAAEAERHGAALLAEQTAQVDAYLQAKGQHGELEG